MPVVLDPDAAAVYKAFQEAGRPPYETVSPAEARALYLKGRAITNPEPPELKSVRPLVIPSPAGSIPARANTLTGLPPAYVLTAGADPLRDEGDEYAARLKEAGVTVTHRTFPGQFHGFFTMGKLLQQANIAASEIGAWLRVLN
jgi:acetyl esterase/lipase